MNNRLATILGLPVPSEGEVTRLDVVDGKAEEVQEVRGQKDGHRGYSRPTLTLL